VTAAQYLIDTSAFARRNTTEEVRLATDGKLLRGEIAVCGVLMLELGYSARNANEHHMLTTQLHQFPGYDVAPADWSRAQDVQGMLAAKGQHRAAKLADLLLAACAEREELTVLHYDHDYDLIAEVTDQATEWVVPRGTVA
jgi:predicted nucleic acid-binding protein